MEIYIGSYEENEIIETRKLLKVLGESWRNIANPHFLKFEFNKPDTLIVLDKEYIAKSEEFDSVYDIRIEEESQLVFYIDNNFDREINVHGNVYAFPNHADMRIWLEIFLMGGNVTLNKIKNNKNIESEGKDKNLHDRTNKELESNRLISEKNIDNNISDMLSNNTTIEENINLIDRYRLIREKTFKQKSERNKTIAVWSPSHRIGVSTFVMNFAIYLGKNNVSVNVLGSLTGRPSMEYLLIKWYEEFIFTWSPFLNTLSNYNIPIDRINLKVHEGGVNWIPTKYNKDNDVETLNEPEIKQIFPNLINDAKDEDILLVDMHTGEMDYFGEETLKYVDELWIVLDGDKFDVFYNQKYIRSLIEAFDLETKIIFNRDTPLSNREAIANFLKLDYIGSIPELKEVITRCQPKFGSPDNGRPIIETKEGSMLLNGPFSQINNYLFGKEKKG